MPQLPYLRALQGKQTHQQVTVGPLHAHALPPGVSHGWSALRTRDLQQQCPEPSARPSALTQGRITPPLLSPAEAERKAETGKVGTRQGEPGASGNTPPEIQPLLGHLAGWPPHCGHSPHVQHGLDSSSWWEGPWKLPRAGFGGGDQPGPQSELCSSSPRHLCPRGFTSSLLPPAAATLPNLGERASVQP